ncbi:hypothetical protein EHS15_03820 [Leptospira idonii]|uniref:Redoxin domain-containing protein n=1 Tax=Leptospira idonii TaxID=1193500 RepID=A0A4R9M5L0_9LEPT|nr:hypothetical protein EHS15_03820 [Leptospira idonii]
MPKFSIEDQYGKTFTHQSQKGKPVLILGCELKDIELCRKLGRKIYWKMQNLLWKDSNKVSFLFYLNLKETNSLVEKYLEDAKSKEFESVLLDRKGELAEGLQREKAYLRIFDKKGKQIHREYLSEVDETKIKEIHSILKEEI